MIKKRIIENLHSETRNDKDDFPPTDAENTIICRKKSARSSTSLIGEGIITHANKTNGWKWGLR